MAAQVSWYLGSQLYLFQHHPQQSSCLARLQMPLALPYMSLAFILSSLLNERLWLIKMSKHPSQLAAYFQLAVAKYKDSQLAIANTLAITLLHCAIASYSQVTFLRIIFKYLFFFNLAHEKATRASCKAEKLKTLAASVFLFMLAFAIRYLLVIGIPYFSQLRQGQLASQLATSLSQLVRYLIGISIK